MKKIKIVCILGFLIGLSILLYPIVSNYLNSKTYITVIEEYNEKVKKIDKEENKILYEKALKYNNDLMSNFQKTFENDERYNSLLHINDTQIMAYIEIPKLNNLKIPIYHGFSKDTLQIGIGHMQGSSLPIGNIGSHSVLFGHRGLPNSELFTNINKLKENDIFYINILNNKNEYKIDKINIVKPEEMVDYFNIDETEDRITLVTCTPYCINTHRLLVSGIRNIGNSIVIDKSNKDINLQNTEDELKQNINPYDILRNIIIILFIIGSILILKLRYDNLGTIFIFRKKDKTKNKVKPKAKYKHKY